MCLESLRILEREIVHSSHGAVTGAAAAIEAKQFLRWFELDTSLRYVRCGCRDSEQARHLAVLGVPPERIGELGAILNSRIALPPGIESLAGVWVCD